MGRRPNATRTLPTARGALTARVPRGTDSDGAHLTAVRLLTVRVGVLTWNRRPQAMPGRGPRTCGWGPRVAPEQTTPGRARPQSPRAPGPGTLGAAHWPSPAGAGRRPEPLEGSVRFARCGSLSISGRQPALHLGEPGRRRPAARSAPRVRTFKFRSVCQSVELRMNLGLQPAQAGYHDDDSRWARGEIF